MAQTVGHPSAARQPNVGESRRPRPRRPRLVWTLPVYPVAVTWLLLAAGPEMITDPVGWADHTVAGEPGWAYLVVAGGVTSLGLAALGGLGTLLLARGGQGRVLAVAGLVAGSVAGLWHLSQLAVAGLAADHPAVAWYAEYHDLLSRTGLASSTLAGLLLGTAVWRCQTLARSDGSLILLAAGLLGLLTLVDPSLGVLVTLAALLWLAAAIGVSRSASRTWPGAGVTRESIRGADHGPGR